MTTTSTVETVKNEDTTPEEKAPGLSLQDLTSVLQIIQVSSARGAFRAEELSQVGSLYDRIFNFLEASGVIVKANDQTKEKK